MVNGTKGARHQSGCWATGQDVTTQLSKRLTVDSLKRIHSGSTGIAVANLGKLFLDHLRQLLLQMVQMVKELLQMAEGKLSQEMRKPCNGPKC